MAQAAVLLREDRRGDKRLVAYVTAAPGANGIVMTIIQTKVPLRLQGRVLAINLTIAAGTAPIGYAILAPYGTRLLRPVMTLSGPAGETTRALVGTGPGRATGLFYVVCGLALAVVVIVARRTRVLARFDDAVPDALADDLLGLAAIRSGRGPARPAGPGLGLAPHAPDGGPVTQRR